MAAKAKRKPAPKARVSKRRLKTEVVDRSLEQMLAGENVDELLANLKPVERMMLDELIDIMRVDGDPSQLDELWRVDYTRKPPTMETFLLDGYWMGETMKPSDDNKGILPIWKESLINDFDLSSRIHNLVITGSLGIGKTWIMCAIFLYRIAMATLLRNPHHFLGISRGSAIVYAIMSVSKSQVQETAFGDATNFMTYCPYFLEECHFNPDLKYSAGKVELGPVTLTSGSKSQHILGRNAMGVCLDEGNWRLEANPDQKAYGLYNEVRTRIENRFQSFAGFLPAISILASSARDETSFTELVIDDIEKAKDDKQQKVYRFAVYDVHSDRKYKPRHFKVVYGLKSMDPYVLEGWYTKAGDRLEVVGSPHEEAPPGAQTKLVPEDYYGTFMRNCAAALQSVAGISTGGSHKLFPSTFDIERCIELAERDGVANPCRLEFLPISSEDDKEIFDYLDHKSFLTKRASMIIPKRHPESPRFAHLDLATKTMAGLSVCHLVGRQKVEGLLDERGQVFTSYRMVVEYDFILTIVAGRTKPISLAKIQNFFFWLRDMCHYHFNIVTADQFQSALPLEMLASRGFETKLLSVDRKKDAYYAWKQGFEELRLRPYKQRQMMVEAEQLVDGPSKVDHPENGSKDTTDACAGAYFNAISSQTPAPSDEPAASGVHVDVMSRGSEEDSPITMSVGPVPEDKSQTFQA